MKYIYHSLTIAISLFIIVSCSTESTPIYQLTTSVEPTEAGTVSPSSSEFEEGEEVNITATTNEHWVFDSWQGGQTGSTNPATITMDSDKNVTAIFIKREYPLTINTEGEGTVSERAVQAKTTDYQHGTTVELTANPADGWRFVEWKGDLTGSENPMSITVDGAKEVQAVFQRKEFVLTVTKEGEGAVSESLISGTETETGYLYESEVQLTADPATGWTFAEWKGDITGSENPATITVDNAKEVTAVFEEVRTELAGIISSNTTLSLADSPYQLTGKVQIAFGIDFIVEKGVEIYGENNVIEVFGKLLIQGTSAEKVLLKNIEIQPGDNSTNELYSIEIKYADIVGGKLYSPSGNSTYGSISLTDSFLYKVNRSGSETYMYIWYPQKDSFIERNIFYNSGRVDVGHKDADVYIRNNLFYRDQNLSNETGYAVENWASYSNSKTVLKKNTFYNKNGVAVSLPSGYDSARLGATENFWNTTSTDEIKGMIFDKNDDLSVNEEIPFDPFLSSPDSNTPVLPDSLK